jgi:hypothetical protein
VKLSPGLLVTMPSFASWQGPRFPMAPNFGQKIVRGRDYLLKVTRPGEDAGLDFESPETTFSTRL